MDNQNAANEEQPVVDPNTPATPEELGVGQRQSNEPFSPIDFDNIIDGAFANLGEKKEEEATDNEPPPQEAPVQEEPKQEVVEKEAEQPEAQAEQPAKEEAKQEEPASEEPKAEEKKDEPNKDIEALESKLGQHTSPKTKKLFNEVKALASKERTERERVAKELEETRKQLDEIKKAKEGIPTNVSEELQQLRDRLRSFDANADPAIVEKYDNTITKNNDTILKTLVDAGLPKEHADKLKKSGISLSNLKPYLDTLESGVGADGKQYDADPDTAEAIRETLRENLRLGKDKVREIEEWRAGYETRTKQTQEQQQKAVDEATGRLNKEFETHLGKWDFLKKPSDIMDSDAPAIRKQKEEAINRYNQSSLKFAETIKNETTDPLNAQIAARIGILYRDHVTPQLQNQLADARKEIESLKAQVGKMKQSGSAAKSIGTVAPRSSPKGNVSFDQGFDDIVDSLASEIANKEV
jgi:hypothetical protein